MEYKEINFDMDGTIADLYGVENWLEMLLAGDTTPYTEAKPLINFSVFARILNKLQRKGYTIGIISWLAKVDNDEYNNRVAEAKRAWLIAHLPSVKWDKINIVAYGTPKSTCGNGILFDDEEPNRKEWKGTAYNVENILKILKNL
jgi:hypothetical protein